MINAFTERPLSAATSLALHDLFEAPTTREPEGARSERDFQQTLERLSSKHHDERETAPASPEPARHGTSPDTPALSTLLANEARVAQEESERQEATRQLVESAMFRPHKTRASAEPGRLHAPDQGASKMTDRPKTSPSKLALAAAHQRDDITFQDRLRQRFETSDEPNEDVIATPRLLTPHGAAHASSELFDAGSHEESSQAEELPSSRRASFEPDLFQRRETSALNARPQLDLSRLKPELRAPHHDATLEESTTPQELAEHVLVNGQSHALWPDGAKALAFKNTELNQADTSEITASRGAQRASRPGLASGSQDTSAGEPSLDGILFLDALDEPGANPIYEGDAARHTSGVSSHAPESHASERVSEERHANSAHDTAPRSEGLAAPPRPDLSPLAAARLQQVAPPAPLPSLRTAPVDLGLTSRQSAAQLDAARQSATLSRDAMEGASGPAEITMHMDPTANGGSLELDIKDVFGQSVTLKITFEEQRARATCIGTQFHHPEQVEHLVDAIRTALTASGFELGEFIMHRHPERKPRQQGERQGQGGQGAEGDGGQPPQRRDVLRVVGIIHKIA